MKFLDYIQGVRRGKDAHRIEHEAMNDPFLSEAIDGYDLIKGNHSDRIAQMQAAVRARTASHKARSGVWKVAVAAVAFIALLSGYFALMNHESSMAQARETENSFINLYAPEVYIEQKRLELTAMKENDPSQDVSLDPLVCIPNIDDVIKPVEVLPLYVPGTYAETKKEEPNEEVFSSADNSKKIFIADASSSVLAEAKVAINQAPKGSSVSDKLKDLWASKEVTEVKRSRIVEVNKKTKDGRTENVMGMTVTEDPQKSQVKNTEATSTLKVTTEEARLLAEQAGFDKIEEVGADELNGNALELNEVETTTRKVSRESYYKPKAVTKSLSVAPATNSGKRVRPEPLMGYKEYKKYLKENIVRPKDGECKDVKGKVIMQISVDQDGYPVNIIVTKGLCRALDKEAVRLVKNGPKWKTGTLRANVEVEF